MKLHIVQGENEFAKDCRSLAEFEIKNMGHSPAARSKVEEKLKKILEMAAVGGRKL